MAQRDRMAQEVFIVDKFNDRRSVLEADGSMRNLITNPNTSPVLSRLVDTLGNPFSTENRVPVDLGGPVTVQNLSVTYESKVSTLNSTTTPLAANATFTGSWEDVRDFAGIRLAIMVDQPSATNGAVLQFSHDGTNVVRQITATIPANHTTGGTVIMTPPQARYIRIIYTNGATAQTLMRSEVSYTFNPSGNVLQQLGATLTDYNLGTVGRAVISGRIYSGASTGAYAPLQANGLGHLSVRVENPVTDHATEATLATRATEATLEAVRVLLANEDFASQATLATRASEATLSALNGKDFATQATLEAVRLLLANEDFASEATLLTRATEATLADLRTNFATYRTNLEARDLATNATLIQVRDYLDTVETLLAAIRDRTRDETTKTLTERMLAKAPAPGYTLAWDLADPTYMYFAEAPVGSAETALVWRGIRAPIGSGVIIERSNFAWSAHTAGW